MACRVLRLPLRRLCSAEATPSQHGINGDSVRYCARLLKVVIVGRGAMVRVGVGMQKQEQEQERAWVWTESGRSSQGR